MPKAKKQDRITHISRVVFEGYKSIDHLEIDLEKGLNILIGPNGSGKSNFLWLTDSIFNKFYSRRYQSVPLGYFTSAAISIKTINNKNLIWRYEIKSKIIGKSERGKIPSHRKLGSSYLYSSEKLYSDSKVVFDSGKIGSRFTDSLPSTLSHVNVRHPSLIFIEYNLPEALIGINIPGNIKIDRKNEGIAFFDQTTFMLAEYIQTFIQNPFLRETKLSREQILSKLILPGIIINNLKKFSPIQDIRFSPNINIYEDENRASIENIILEFYVNDNWVPWSYLSDGTKRLFYLISEISYFENAIILIEEPELGVHPDQFHLIMNFLKEQAEDKQIIMSTHSPEALNILSEDGLNHIIVTKYDKKKGTTMAHLGSKQIAKAKVYMKKVGFLSDYWLQSDLEG